MPSFTATFFRRTKPAYAALAGVWATIVVWQGVEHLRVREAARAALINRSQDISGTLGLVLRSQRRWGLVSEERLEPAMRDLVRSGELSSIALLNASGEVVVSAGSPIDLNTHDMLQVGERWDSHRVVLVNLVDLGLNSGSRGETNRPTIVMPRRERDPSAPPRDEDRERPRPEWRGDPLLPPPPPPEFGPSPEAGATNRPERDRPGGWPRFGRPPFRMDEEEYKELLERRGLHGIVIAMSTDTYRHARNQDLWMRCIIGVFAGLSVVGLGLAWRNLATTSELQMRLLRASELNTHLKEMNLAAAGLAHETRNPLNIIRGVAQMISRQEDATPEVRRKTREIIDETDRVTAQLNEFINYSRPREVRRSAVPLGVVVGEVARALTYDLEEKSIRLRVPDGLPVIEADEQLLRQALFNLLLNAVQAVERGGEIEVAAWRQNGHGAVLEIRDNGPGVPPEQRQEIFKPYFTTHQRGTGLGLAVVQQIVLAHGWEIECGPNTPRGAVFRLTHLATAART